MRGVRGEEKEVFLLNLTTFFIGCLDTRLKLRNWVQVLSNLMLPLTVYCPLCSSSSSLTLISRVRLYLILPSSCCPEHQGNVGSWKSVWDGERSRNGFKSQRNPEDACMRDRLEKLWNTETLWNTG